MSNCSLILVFFFFNDTATTEIYTLSLHDALPISPASLWARGPKGNDLGLRAPRPKGGRDRKSTRLNSSHVAISYAVFCLKKKGLAKTLVMIQVALSVLLVVGAGLMLGTFWKLFFFNDTATTEIYTLSLHDALPISVVSFAKADFSSAETNLSSAPLSASTCALTRSEEHTSELQSRPHLVCRLL